MIKQEIKEYIRWCKVKNLVPNEFKNLKMYCDMCIVNTYEQAREKNMCLSK